KAKADMFWRFWGFVHICKIETLHAAYAMAKNNDRAPGVDGVTFAAIERQGVEAFLGQIRDDYNFILMKTGGKLGFRRLGVVPSMHHVEQRRQTSDVSERYHHENPSVDFFACF